MNNKSQIAITGKTTLAEVVSSSISFAEVLDRYDIDYGNYGKMSICEACSQFGLNCDAVVKDLRNKEVSDRICQNISDWDVAFLCDFITTNLHIRIRKLLPEIHSLFKSLERRNWCQEKLARWQLNLQKTFTRTFRKSKGCFIRT
jgi:iron-sulfur cluster repair protein YtfE (RIC family)